MPVLFSVLQSKGVAARKVGKYKKSITHKAFTFEVSNFKVEEKERKEIKG